MSRLKRPTLLMIVVPLLVATACAPQATATDRAQAVAYPQGSVVFTPAGTPHWMWARDGAAVLQETGHGPTANEAPTD